MFAGLIATNAYIFVSSMKLGEKINHFETKTSQLHRENLELKKKLYETNSLQHAASVAAAMNFTQKAEPYYLENLGFAKTSHSIAP